MSATTPERWARIKALFQSALPLDLAERADHLDTGCDGDEELRREVQELLAFHDRNPEFLETSALAIVARLGNAAGTAPALNPPPLLSILTPKDPEPGRPHAG